MNQQPNKLPKPANRKRSYIAAGSIAVLGLTTVLGAQAYTGSRISQHINIEKAYSGDSGKVWKTGWRGGGSHFGSMSEAEREKHITRMVKHLAVEIDASAEQQTTLVALIKSVATEMMPMKEKMQQSREMAIKLLTAPTIDREAIEAMRVAKLAEADSVSKTLAAAVADAAEILTPEQRKTVAERIESFRKMRGGWRH